MNNFKKLNSTELEKIVGGNKGWNHFVWEVQQFGKGFWHGLSH
ncbi:ComC/BlpC family leader-containing pheromone/bacteriocin [Lactobacillus kalixensis]|nr:ComC/BlpC family leader-containing pheromone/bacteriocin [Lactobacillus kalixensis]